MDGKKLGFDENKMDEEVRQICRFGKG